MRVSILRTTLITGCLLLAGSVVWGQSMGPEKAAPANLDLAVTYNPTLANVTTPQGFGMQGGSVQVQARVWRRIGIVADVAELHNGNVNGSGVALDLLTTTFGPRYTWSPAHHRVVLFGQALVGEAFGLNGLFPSPTGVNSTGRSMALQIGGGITLPLTSHFAVRALDADWLRTQLPNATTNVQNNLRLGAGLVYRFR